jgi:hypothetical protein
MHHNEENMDRKKTASLDYYLILATALVLFVISAISVYGMFYFKFAAVQEMEPAAKMAYMNGMNEVIAPFIIILILLLGICVPKRLLPARLLVRFTLVLSAAALAATVWLGIKAGVMVVLAASLLLQLVVLGLAAAGSRHLHFEKSGYWLRVGSSLIHLGLILFVLDLLLHRHLTLHLVLFWITTGASVLGMLFCFYSPSVARIFQNKGK